METGMSQIGYGAAYPTLAAIPNGSITGSVHNTWARQSPGQRYSTSTGGYTTTSASDGSYTLANVPMYSLYRYRSEDRVQHLNWYRASRWSADYATPLQFSLTPIATSSIKQARGMADGAIVRISAVISAEFASSFYITETSPRSGIKVLTTTTRAEGSSATVSGYADHG